MSKTVKHETKRPALKPTKTAGKKIEWEFPLSRTNFIYLAVGLGVIIIAFALMATGISDEAATVDGKWNNPLAVQVAPILLVIGYCVIIPLGILKLFKKKEDVQE